MVKMEWTDEINYGYEIFYWFGCKGLFNCEEGAMNFEKDLWNGLWRITYMHAMEQ